MDVPGRAGFSLALALPSVLCCVCLCLWALGARVAGLEVVCNLALCFLRSLGGLSLVVATMGRCFLVSMTGWLLFLPRLRPLSALLVQSVCCPGERALAPGEPGGAGLTMSAMALRMRCRWRACYRRGGGGTCGSVLVGCTSRSCVLLFLDCGEFAPVCLRLGVPVQGRIALRCLLVLLVC